MQSLLKIAFLLLSICLYSQDAISQYSVTLTKGTARQKIEVDLHNIDGGTRLTKLPLFFHLTDKDVLILILGNDQELENNSTVWLFGNQQEITVFTKEHPLIKIDKNFKKRNPSLNPFLKTEDNLTLYKELPNGFAVVKDAITPVFIKIPKDTRSFSMDLQFYVSNKSNNTDILTAKCIPVKVQLKVE